MGEHPFSASRAMAPDKDAIFVDPSFNDRTIASLLSDERFIQANTYAQNFLDTNLALLLQELPIEERMSLASQRCRRTRHIHGHGARAVFPRGFTAPSWPETVADILSIRCKWVCAPVRLYCAEAVRSARSLERCSQGGRTRRIPG